MPNSLPIGSKALMITRSDDGVINLTQEGIIIETLKGSTSIGLQTNPSIHGYSPIYSTQANVWTLVGSDIKEKVKLYA